MCPAFLQLAGSHGVATANRPQLLAHPGLAVNIQFQLQVVQPSLPRQAN